MFKINVFTFICAYFKNIVFYLCMPLSSVSANLINFAKWCVLVCCRAIGRSKCSGACHGTHCSRRSWYVSVPLRFKSLCLREKRNKQEQDDKPAERKTTTGPDIEEEKIKVAQKDLGVSKRKLHVKSMRPDRFIINWKAFWTKVGAACGYELALPE